jgi:hypothetical protein
MSVKTIVKSETKQEIGAYKNPLPAVRDVSPPAVVSSEGPQVIAVYKDLNQPARDQAQLQNRNLAIAVIIFTVLGAGILMGQHFSKKRGVASVEMNKLIPAGAEATSEHYHYDKSCYTGPGGEQVCMTRTSQQR